MEYSELQNIRLEDVNRENFAQGTEKCKLFGNLMDKDDQKLGGSRLPQVWKLVDHEVLEELPVSTKDYI